MSDIKHEVESKTLFGFWIFLWTDFMLFATLFATYAVLNNAMYTGPSIGQLYRLPLAFMQTLLLLGCSFVSGLGGIAAQRRHKGGTLTCFMLTFLLGMAFMGIEFSELSRMVVSGDSWQKNAFLSAFFTLVGTHGFHLFFGLLWILVLLWPILRENVTEVSVRRLTCLRMFWQFLNIVWIFIFALVYLYGGK